MPYIPEHDAMRDIDVLRGFVAKHPLAHVVTHDGQAPDVNLIPLLMRESDDSPTGLSLIGHVARSNLLWQPGAAQGTVMASFGPAEHYISPTWYPSKAEHHRAVPTWNYLIAHAWGDLVVHDDSKWVRAQVAQLTTAMESSQPEPWRMGMAPADYLNEMVAKIVGIEIRVTRLEGRFKVSSHRTDADRLGARDGVTASGQGAHWDELASTMSTPPESQTRLGRL